jgi:hypothetical protein
MSNFKVTVIGGVIVSVASAPLLGKDATGMVQDLGKYTGLIANAAATTTSDVVFMSTVRFELQDGSGKTVEAPARPIKPVHHYRLP